MCLGGIMAQLVTHDAEVDKATVVWNFLSSELERVKNCGGDSDTTRYVNTHISRGDSAVVRHGGGAIAAIDIGPSQRQALPHRSMHASDSTHGGSSCHDGRSSHTRGHRGNSNTSSSSSGQEEEPRSIMTNA